MLCNNVGGTPEIVKDSGVVIDIDPPLKYKMFSMGKVDKVKSHTVAMGIIKLLDQTWDIQRPDLEMSVCAQQYYNYFQIKLKGQHA